MNFDVSNEGFYGEFGGAYIPEMLYANVEELRERYLSILQSETFQTEFTELLRDYAGRPSPLFHAKRLSEKTGASVWLKREDLLHTGAHKINNTVGQILMARHLGKTRIIAETGAGQHGVATATVCALTGMQCVVYMGDTDIARQQPNVMKMKMLGAEVIAVHSGNKTLKDATNEAIRDWINHPRDTHYIIGSVVGPHPYPDLVSRLQSVISEELLQQVRSQTGKEDPDAIIACVGGGSNAMGAFYHYLEREKVRLIGVEASGMGVDTGETAATLAVGRPGIIHGSHTMLMQDDDGQILEPYSISAGLDYPGIGPVHAYLNQTGRVEYASVTDREALDAAFLLTRMEGIIPALETAHALAALEKLNFRSDELIIVNLSGRGDKDMGTYTKIMENEQD
jgi:tryptophan synthase beta chain